MPARDAVGQFHRGRNDAVLDTLMIAPPPVSFMRSRSRAERNSPVRLTSITLRQRSSVTVLSDS